MSQLLNHNYIMNYNFSLSHIPNTQRTHRGRQKQKQDQSMSINQISSTISNDWRDAKNFNLSLTTSTVKINKQQNQITSRSSMLSANEGYHIVSNKGKWQEINISLQYEKKLWGLAKHYQQFILPLELQLLEHFPEYLKQGWSGENQMIEMHLIVPNNITAGYYQITPLQLIFAENNFFSMDQYFNLKTLALLQPAEIARIPVQYADKFMMLRKWLFFNYQIDNSTPKELKALGIQDNLESIKIIIVGLSLSSLLIADKLSEFGLNIVIFDKSKKQARFRDDYQLVENGLMLLEGGKQFGSYYSHLTKNKIELEEVNANFIALLGDDGKPILQEILRLSEQHFFSMIQDLKGDIMNKKNLYEQITSRLIRKKLQNQRFLIKWHHDRYMMFNRIKGDGTTVGDLITYQNKKFIKHIAQPHTFVTVRSIDKLWNKVKQKKKITIVQTLIDNISYRNNCWSVINYRGQIVHGSHLIYSDHQSIYRGILQNNSKFTEINHQIMVDSLPIFQQLTIMKYVNCLYKFSQKIILKDPIKHLNYFSINCAYGAIFCYLLNNGTQILTSLKCFHNSNVNYYVQILNILESKIIINKNKILNEEYIYAFDYSFGLKDQKYMESIIRLKQNQKLFCMLPITTTNCPHRMAAQLDMSNYICGIILDECYPNYQRCESFIKQEFKQNPLQITKEDKNMQLELIRTISQTEKIKNNNSIISIPTFSSGKNIPSLLQNSKKQRVVTAIPNEDTSNIYQIIEGQIPSVFALHQLNDDWFGLKNNLVKGYETYIKSRVQVSSKIREGIKHINHLQITQPIMLSPNLYLYSLGQPYLSDWEWFNCLLPKTNKPLQINYVFVLNKMITRREYLSLQDTFRTTIYYQTILVINNQIYYCLIDENNSNVIYYHKDLSLLITKFNYRLNQLRVEEIDSIPLIKKNINCIKMIRCKMERYPPNHLLSSRIEEQIRNELRANNDQLSLNHILDNKLCKSHSNENKKRYMGSEQDIFYPQQQVFTFESQNQSIANKIYSQVCNYLLMTQRIYEIKQFSLFELFFGILDEQHICCEIMRKFTENPLSFSELQKLDSQLGQQIQQIFSKNIPNQINSLIILPNQGYAMIHRNFMSLNRANKFQKYTYKKIFKQNNSAKVSHYLIINKEQKEFKNTEQIIKVIIQKLCPHFHSNQIISKFQILINRQIQNEANLSPLIKIYFRMTKKCIADINPPPNGTKLTQKFKELSERQKQNGYKLMKKKTLRWVQNDFVFMH